MPPKEKGLNKDVPKKKPENKQEGDQAAKGAKAQTPPGTIPKEFFNPKSMLTPGLCGGVTMLITNALAAQFGAPPNYTGLIISCLFGLIVFAATATVLWLRAVFWALNSLVIFSIALGSNQIGVQTSKRKETASLPSILPFASLSVNPKNAFFANWLDNTVPKRTELALEIQNLDAVNAQEVVKHLGVTQSYITTNMALLGTNWAKLYLEKAVRKASNVEALERCALAIRDVHKDRFQ